MSLSATERILLAVSTLTLVYRIATGEWPVTVDVREVE